MFTGLFDKLGPDVRARFERTRNSRAVDPGEDLSTVTAAHAVETDYWPAAVARDLLACDARFADNGLPIVSDAIGGPTDRLAALAEIDA